MAKPTIYEAELDQFLQDEDNANRGTQRGQRMLDRSAEELGAARSLVVDRNDQIVAGNKTQQALLKRGIKRVIVIESEGEIAVIHKRTDFDLDDQNPNNPARRYAYYDNRTSELDLLWNPSQIRDDVAAGIVLDDIFTPDEIETILEQIVDDLGNPEGQEPKTKRRTIPLDVIYTIQGADCSCCLAVQAGLKYGIPSQDPRICPYTGKLSGRHAVAFIDAPFYHYDHAAHLDTVKAYRPTYTTVRDYMGRAQCDREGITYYELATVLAWAEELAEYAEHVIVTPHVDVLEHIPPDFTLGYTIRSPIPIQAYAGRDVHLLDGLWKDQLFHMAILDDDVQSVEVGHIHKHTSYGGFLYADGGTAKLGEALPGLSFNNARYVALALSFGAIGAKLHELHEGIL